MSAPPPKATQILVDAEVVPPPVRVAPLIYFAGINQHHYAQAFSGKHVLETFADVRSLMDRYRPTFASLVLDSGAFTEMNTGAAIDLGAYADFCLRHRDGYRWVASLDAIRGGADANINNWQALRGRGVESVPTFHQGEPLRLLDWYCSAAPRIGLGFQRPIQSARPWLDACFARIPARVKVHGWAMTAFTDYPFESVDSTTWIFELNALRAVKGQGADVLMHITDGELLDLVIKKYERAALRARWGREERSENLGLFDRGAA